MNIFFLAANAINNMLHVNNNCTDFLEFLETCFQVVGVTNEVLLM